MTKDTKAFFIGMAIFIISMITFLLGKSANSTYLSIANFSAIMISMIGVYIIVRAILILANVIYLPQIPLFGGFMVKCVELVLIGIGIGLLAPIWSVCIWFAGAGCGFFTEAWK